MGVCKTKQIKKFKKNIMSHGLACDFNTTRMTTEGMLQTEIYFLNLREASFASGFNSVQRLYSKFFIKVKSLHLLLTLFSWSVLVLYVTNLVFSGWIYCPIKCKMGEP